MPSKETGPDIPSAQDLAAFAKEYYKAYMDAIEEKKPQTPPKFAQEGPYHIRSYRLPNGCICMVFNTSNEQKVEGAAADWDEVQEIIVKGVDSFSGIYPFEGRSLADWSKRGKKDALRDLRLMDKSQLGKAGAELEMIMENVAKMIKLNVWLKDGVYKGSETLEGLRNLETRLKGSFPTVDAIATLQSLKAYAPGEQSVTIEFPEKERLEEILEGVKNLADTQNKLEAFESRVFEIEKAMSATEPGRTGDLQDRVERIEKQLEKVSNILTMLNSKVETYFSKAAERERQADLERMIGEHTSKAMSHDAKLVELEKETEDLVEEIRKMAARLDKDIHDSRKRIARIERHFVDFAKVVQE